MMTNDMGKQLTQPIVLENGKTAVVAKEVVAPMGQPAVDIPGLNAKLVVTPPDTGSTAVQVSGSNVNLRNRGEISGALNGVLII